MKDGVYRNFGPLESDLVIELVRLSTALEGKGQKNFVSVSASTHSFVTQFELFFSYY